MRSGGNQPLTGSVESTGPRLCCVWVHAMPEPSHDLHRGPREGGVREHELLELVAERAPDDALARIATGDPLRMLARCAARIRERALLIDPDRLVQGAVVQVAYASSAYRGDPPVDQWLEALVDRSIERILTEDIESGRTDGLRPDDERYAFAAKLLCLDPARARLACVRFNALCQRARRSFFTLVLEGRTVADAIARGLGPAEALREACLDAFRAITYLGDDEDLPSAVQSDPRGGHE